MGGNAGSRERRTIFLHFPLPHSYVYPPMSCFLSERALKVVFFLKHRKVLTFFWSTPTFLAPNFLGTLMDCIGQAKITLSNAIALILIKVHTMCKF